MTYSKLGYNAELTKRIDLQTGREEIISVAKINPQTGKKELVSLPKTSRLLGTYIIGGTGQGKTGLIENLIMQDIDQQIGVCVLDPHDDLTNNVLARIPQERIDRGDVILLDVLDTAYPFGLNLYQCEDPTDEVQLQETYERVAHIFDLLWLENDEDRLGPLVSQGLRNSTYTLIANAAVYGCGMLELPLLYGEDIPRAHLIANVSDIIRPYWDRYNLADPNRKASLADIVVNKVDDYIANPILRRIIGQSKSTINFRKIMDEGKILLVKLPGDFEDMTELLGSMIIAQLLAAAYSRKDIQQIRRRRQFNIYADEFQRFASRDFTKLLTETRKYGTATTIAHQARDFIDLRNRSASLQVGNLIVLKIIHKDAEELAGNFYLQPSKGEPVERAIRTPVRDVIHHLLTRGSHPHPAVDHFITTWGIRALEQYYRGELDGYKHTQPYEGLNDLLYQTMVTGDASLPIPLDVFGNFCSFSQQLFPSQGKSFYGWSSEEFRLFLSRPNDTTLKEQIMQQIQARAYMDIKDFLLRGVANERRKMIIIALSFPYSVTKSYPTLESTPKFAVPYRVDLGGVLEYARFDEEASDEEEEQNMWIYLSNMYNYVDTNTRQVAWLSSVQFFHTWDDALAYLLEKQQGRWYHSKKDALHWKEIRTGSTLMGVFYEPSYYQYKDVRGEVPSYAASLDCIIWRLTSGQAKTWYTQADLEAEIEKLLPQRISEYALFLSFIKDLRQLMQALAEQPIEEASGLWEVTTGKSQTIADRAGEIANELANLPKYTAKVKLTTDDGATVEYIIKTLAPENGLEGNALQDRIARIKRHMIDARYVRSKGEIDEEIRKRHEALRQDRQQQPPTQGYARQVKLQGTCPNCGTSNRPGAKFCNECRAKLLES